MDSLQTVQFVKTIAAQFVFSVLRGPQKVFPVKTRNIPTARYNLK